MKTELPIFISLLFGATTIISVIWFYLAAKSKAFLPIIISWSVLISLIALSGFFLYTESMPPRFTLAVVPTFLMMLYLFFSERGQRFINGIDLKTLTFFNTIRIPVEIVLALLYHYGLISIFQTFEGINFDILSGITAPIVAYLFFIRKSISKNILLGWNIICLLLVLNVVITSILAAPTPFQQIAFDQPNIGILYFPFILLPAVVVPLVIFGHLVSISRLMKSSYSV